MIGKAVHQNVNDFIEVSALGYRSTIPHGYLNLNTKSFATKPNKSKYLLNWLKNEKKMKILLDLQA